MGRSLTLTEGFTASPGEIVSPELMSSVTRWQKVKLVMDKTQMLRPHYCNPRTTGGCHDYVYVLLLCTRAKTAA